MPERNPRRWLILGVLCLSLLVVVIDNMVLNIAIPSLIRDLGASTSEIAIFSTMLSMTTTSKLRQSTPRMSHRRGLRSGITDLSRTVCD